MKNLKRLLTLTIALALFCSYALADYGTVQGWLDAFDPLNDVRYFEDAVEAMQILIADRFPSYDPGPLIQNIFSSLSDQQLKDISALCSSELRSRSSVNSDWILLFEHEDVKVYQFGEAEIDRFGSLCVPVVLVDDSDFGVILSIKNAKCNGFEVFSDGPSTQTPHSKIKGKLTFNVDEAFVDSIDQIESISFTWWVIYRDSDKESYKQAEPEGRLFWN